MKIFIVSELFKPSTGGQEIRYEELGQELIKLGHSVKIFTIKTNQTSPSFETFAGIEISRITNGLNYKLNFLRRNPWTILVFTFKLWKLRRHLKTADIVIFNIWPVLPQLILGWVLKNKIIIDICEIRSGLFWKLIYRLFTYLPKVRFICVNPAIIDYMHEKHKVQTSNCHLLLSGVNLEKAGVPPFEKNNHQLLFFGRITKHKNLSLLLEAFLESKIYENCFELHVAGSGQELTKLKLNFNHKNIFFHGEVSNEIKWDILRRSSLLIMPSYREGFPRVVAEAACVGTPTLSLNYPDNGTCFIVRKYKIGEICGASKKELICELKKIAKKEKLYAQLYTKNLNQARDSFSLNTTTKSLIDFLTTKRN